MLLITRREGEGIVINGSMEIKVLEIRGGRVKLGFEYPVGNTVFRQELFAKIQAENQAAALASKADTERLTAAVQKFMNNNNKKKEEENGHANGNRRNNGDDN